MKLTVSMLLVTFPFLLSRFYDFMILLISKSRWWLLKPKRLTLTLHHNKFTYLDYSVFLLSSYSRILIHIYFHIQYFLLFFWQGLGAFFFFAFFCFFFAFFYLFFSLLSAGTGMFTIRQFLFFVDYHLVWSSGRDLVISLYFKIPENYVRIPNCADTSCLYGQIKVFCTIPSGLPTQPRRVFAYTLLALVCCIRLLAYGQGDQRSFPGHVIPKTLKVVLDTSLFNTQQYKVRIKIKVEQPGKGVAPSLKPRCCSYWKRILLVAFDYSRQLLFISSLSPNNLHFIIIIIVIIIVERTQKINKLKAFKHRIVRRISEFVYKMPDSSRQK